MFCKFEKVEVNIDKLEKMKVNSKKPFNVLRKKMWTLTDSRKCKWTEKGEPFDVLLWESRHKHWQIRESVYKWIDEPFDVLQTCRAQSPLLQQFQVLHWGQISIQTFFVKSFTSSEEERKWFHWYISLLVFILISTIPLKIFHPLSWKC